MNRETLRTVWRTFSLTWRVDRRFVLVASVLMGVGGLIPIAMSYLFRLALDSLIKVTTVHGVITVALIGIFALRYLIEAMNDFSNTFLYSYTQRLTRYKLQNHLNLEISRKISSLDVDHFQNSGTQDLIDKVRREALGRIPQYTQNILFLITYGTGFVGSVIALIPYGAWIPLLAVAISIPRYRVRRAASSLEWSIFNWRTPMSRRLNATSNMLQRELTVTEIRLAGSREALLARVEGLQRTMFESLGKPLNQYLAKIWVPILLEAGFIFFMVYLKLPAVVSGALTIGSLTFLVSMFDSVIGNTQRINEQVATLVDDSQYVKDYFDLMDLPPLIAERAPGYKFEAIAPPKVVFERVGFTYPGGTEPALENISFTIEPGEHLAIVGPNGAGKTTLIKLMLRFYDPTVGRILVNDVDLKDIPREHWYKFVGTLFQDFGRYPLTVKENIAFNELDHPDEARVRTAAKLADAAEFIERFPKQYDEQLGRDFDGKELSGGQWQKVALARAFYEQAPVLVLDEPTSAIDAEAEAEIFDNIAKVYEDKTVIFISHRFSTVRHAHKIMVLRGGKITERGTHQSLLAKNGVYARMFRKQAKGYIE